ncbi:nuclear transport factor 2 family protein [Roseateles cellulosilyticus]|uniref:Nuclear transport factor 2 family protein n=1 Tax=Pelomonas cellulosilytica TaxID=2906762 RepID=A0ABS8XY07_9BURK|nr:nuclear transport factor 2 family protein [Pelomonas sp. P8]MCE4555614.1 nuclear transport factor 2 family protein [Pelomonas sp. P8]
MQMNADEQVIRHHHATWMAAVNAGDFPALLQLATDDMVLMGPGQAPFGQAVFQATFAGAHERFRVHCDSELQEIVVVGELAYTRCRDALTLTPRAGGDTMTLAGDRLTVYRKEAGRWRLARDAHTLVPATA